MDRTGQVLCYGVGVELFGETGRERGQHPFGTITGAVEPAVHPVLDPGAERAEQGRRGQRGAGHCHRGRDLDDLGSQQDQAGVGVPGTLPLPGQSIRISM
jgi:hypothetical protein